jgi:hypothetical protein
MRQHPDPTPEEMARLQGELLAEFYLAKGIPEWAVESMTMLTLRTGRQPSTGEPRAGPPPEPFATWLMEGVRQALAKCPG